MQDASLSSFESPSRHAAVSEIIRRTSTNQADVRSVVLEGLDLSSVRTVLDLGCGFGFMTEAIAERVAADAHLIGVDVWAANEEPYLERVSHTGRSGRFVCERIETQLDWPDDSFDLVVASYALYFFAGALPEVARILAPDGLFLAVTHTHNSCRELLRAVGLAETNSRLLALMRSFCAENAEGLLTPWFGEVQRVDYLNSLAFDGSRHDDFVEYVRFKLPLLWPGARPVDELPQALARVTHTALSHEGQLVLEKNDAAFRCRRPRWP